MAHKNNEENLRPFTELTEEEHKELSRKGGIASGETRRNNAMLRKTLNSILDDKYKGDKTFREAATLGLIAGAIKGKAENYKLIAQLTGELEQTESQTVIDWTPLAELIRITPEEKKEHEDTNTL